MGVNLGVAVHLAFDLFPRAWKGYALVSLPFYGWMPPLVCWVWIALVGFACFYMAAKLVREWWGRRRPCGNGVWPRCLCVAGGTCPVEANSHLGG